jgi:hypothetical protein
MKSLELSNQPALTESQMGDRSQIWAEILFDFIPEKDLKFAFNQAFADNKTDFPVSAMMVKNGYQTLLDQRRKRALEADIASSQANASDDYQCPYCFNSGFCGIDHEGYLIPLQKHNPRGVHKCQAAGCEYWERRRAKLRN